MTAAPDYGDLIAELTRPIIGIANRTPEEAFDIMTDRIRNNAAIRNLVAEREGLRRCLLPVQMTLLERDLSGDPVPDNDVVLSFMGAGASDQVTAGEIRAALTRGASK